MNNSFKHFFTVFTPTYNRGIFLKRVYNSLLSQIEKDFEWVIVDDGSIDNTISIVLDFVREGKLKIKYFYQHNKGKHAAVNVGRTLAEGFLFVIVDSDDWLLPESLKSIKESWESIPENERNFFAGVAGLCSDKTGKIIGDRYPSDILDSNSIETRTKYGVKGDKFEVFRTDILRNYPFLKDIGNFVTEALIWNRIALKYKLRFVNQIWAVKEYQADGLSAKSILGRSKSPDAACLYYKKFGEVESLLISTKECFKSFNNLTRYSLHKGKLVYSKKRFFYPWLLIIPIGFILYVTDLIKIKSLDGCSNGTEIN